MTLRKLAVPTAAILFVLACQWATVRANYGGNWTGLFCTGSRSAVPPSLAFERIYIFPDSFGYDGQVYHYIAHDPFFQHGLKRYVDDPALRYRRILVPLLAWTLAAGNPQWIDAAYIAVCLLFVGLGAYWLAEYSAASGHSRWLGFLFVFLPAVIVSADRLVLDGALAALCAGAALYSKRVEDHRIALWFIVAAAALTRETGALIPAAFVLVEAWRRNWKTSAFFATALAPCLAWWAFVAANTRNLGYPNAFIPLSGIAASLLHPFPYPDRVKFIPVIHALDALALLAVLLAMVLAAVQLRRRISFLSAAACLFALLLIFIQRPDNWVQAYDYGRVVTPMLFFVALDWFESRSLLPLAPLLMLAPRIGVQLIPQVEGVLRRFW